MSTKWLMRFIYASILGVVLALVVVAVMGW